VWKFMMTNHTANLAICARIKVAWLQFMISSSDEGQVIVVYRADYGRRDITTCSDGRPDSQLQNVQCSSPNSTEYVANSCDGKKMCDIDIVGLFGTHDPNICKYLDTTYACFPAIHSVTCEGSVANLQCDEGQVIVVYWADFGRRDTTTCSDHRPKHEIQNVQCLNPTTKVADSCNGKSSCAIEASCSVFGDPCVGTYKYLEVAYDCQCKWL
uniref:SUEL-type lectin domain-containing protein n=1 Tax=Amphilophus citrinellus TaxID=61819 RepID=A0A3Q0RJF6_AMPCI